MQPNIDITVILPQRKMGLCIKSLERSMEQTLTREQVELAGRENGDTIDTIKSANPTIVYMYS